MGKIYNVDFTDKKLISVENVEDTAERLDPVLERIKDKMEPKAFEIFKRTVDVWMQENFLYEMEQNNKKD